MFPGYCSEAGYRITRSAPGQFRPRGTAAQGEERTPPKDAGMGDANLARNFVDGVKRRQTPLCPLEVGHRSTGCAHLPNITLKIGSRLQWDSRTETFTNSAEANRLLHDEYRKPWKSSWAPDCPEKAPAPHRRFILRQQT